MVAPTTGEIFTLADLTDQVTETVINDLERGLVYINTVIKQHNFTDKDIVAGVFRGSATRIASRAAIRVISEGKETNWFATRVRNDTYKFNIDCLSKLTARKEEIEAFINTFAGAVQAYLIRFNNLQPAIVNTNVKAYNAWSDNYQKGFNEGGAYRVARIPYYIQIHNPYMSQTAIRSLVTC